MKRLITTTAVLVTVLIASALSTAASSAVKSPYAPVWDDSSQTVSFTTQDCDAPVCNWQLFVDEPDAGKTVVGVATGTQGVLTVDYPSDFCGVLQADVSLNGDYVKGNRHTVDNCTPPTTTTTTTAPPTTTTTTTSPTTPTTAPPTSTTTTAPVATTPTQPVVPPQLAPAESITPTPTTVPGQLPNIAPETNGTTTGNG